MEKIETLPSPISVIFIGGGFCGALVAKKLEKQKTSSYANRQEVIF